MIEYSVMFIIFTGVCTTGTVVLLDKIFTGKDSIPPAASTRYQR